MHLDESILELPDSTVGDEIRAISANQSPALLMNYDSNLPWYGPNQLGNPQLNLGNTGVSFDLSEYISNPSEESNLNANAPYYSTESTFNPSYFSVSNANSINNIPPSNGFQLETGSGNNANSFKSNSQKSKKHRPGLYEYATYKENINVNALEFKKKLCKLFFKNKQLGKDFIIPIINNIISMLSNDESGEFHDLVCREGKITREQLDSADIRSANRNEKRKAYALFNHLAEDADVWLALFKAWLKLKMGN